MAVAPDDWRLEQLLDQDNLKGVSWICKAYREYREGWDHDHCCACTVKLAEPYLAGEDVLHEGYATTAAYHLGADYEWACPTCFSELSEVMGWVDESERLPEHLH